MTKPPPTIEEFLMARIKEVERKLLDLPAEKWAILEAVLNNQRLVIEWHKNWPVLVETPLQMDFGTSDDSINTITYKMTQKLAWMTQDEYRKRFGSEPPTAPLLREMAMMWCTHPDWQEEWKTS